jgi:uridylate kinase
MTVPSRLLLKLSGEAFKQDQNVLSATSLDYIVSEIAPLVDVELAIVVGGGNVIRGAKSSSLARVEADWLGMLATIINALALRTRLEEAGRETIVQSAVTTELTERVDLRSAQRALVEGQIVIFAGGTGNPLVTTDTAAALRGAAMNADLLAKASNVAGVYTGDPHVDPNARFLDEVGYDLFLSERYAVMDTIAVEICREHDLPIAVFHWQTAGGLAALARGERVGTLIH